MEKFNNLVKRLTNKVRMSATPVTGFVLGLSGTDSIVTYILLNEVAKTEGFSVTAIHYSNHAEPNFVKTTVIPWLKSLNYKTGKVECVIHPQADDDNFRWALLHSNDVPRQKWVASTTNATEKKLGKFSIMANSASIAPIISLYKSEVLKICEYFNVPKEITARSRIPDCICGRDEFAAENIELIDSLLSYKYIGGYTIPALEKALEYIRETKKQFDFKNRTPYSV